MTEKRKKRKAPSSPKPRHVWKIRPETRVKPSQKIYRRGKTKKSWVEDVNWFGDLK